MKRYIICLISVLFLLAPSFFAAAQKGSEPLSVMSYNIRNGLEKDGTNSWDYRYPASGMMIEEQDPDVLCLQEPLWGQVNYLKNVLYGYKYIGVGAKDGKDAGELAAIMYKPKTISVGKWGTFWLSDTPDEPSDSWDGESRLTATWAILKHKKSGKRFFLVNVRIAGEQNLSNGVKLVAAKVQELNTEGLPVVVGGDFNLEYSSAALMPLKAFLSNAREDAARSDETPSYNGWGKSSATIDHIWFSGFSSCVSFETITKEYYERNFISDHYPVKASLIF